MKIISKLTKDELRIVNWIKIRKNNNSCHISRLDIDWLIFDSLVDKGILRKEKSIVEGYYYFHLVLLKNESYNKKTS